MKELRKECEVWKYWIIIILNKKKKVTITKSISVCSLVCKKNYPQISVEYKENWFEFGFNFVLFRLPFNYPN